MKRLTTASLAVVAAFALSACKGGGGGAATKFIPDGAEFAGGVNVASLAKEDVFKDLKGMAEKNDEAGMAALAKECKVDVWALDSVVMAGTAKGDKEMAVVVSGSGVGAEANVKCLIDKAKEKGAGDDDFKLDGKTLTLDGGDATAYLVDDNTLVIAGKDWAGKVKEIVDGGGKSAKDGSLKDALGAVDAGKHIWMAGNIPAEMAGDAMGAKSGWGTMDFSGGGLAVDGQAKFADADSAKKIVDMANAQKDNPQAKGMAPKTAESAKIEADGDKVKVSAKMPKDEFDKIKGMAMAFAG
jgi:hypothetical protein